MRFLFSVSNWPAHYFSMVPTGWALQAAGHEVRVVCDASQAGPVSHAGLVPVPVLRSPALPLTARLVHYLAALRGRWAHSHLPLHPVSGEPVRALADFDAGAYLRDTESATIDATAGGVAAALAFVADWRPDVVLRDPMSWEGLLLRMATGRPGAVHLWGPVSPPEQQGGGHFLRFLPPRHRAVFARHGIEGSTPPPAEPVVDPCPGALAPPVTGERIPIRYVPYHGPGAVPAWLHPQPRRPRIAVVWSTSTTQIFGPATFVVPAVLRALAGLDVDVVAVLTEADAARLDEVPPNASVAAAYVPLHLLLPTCALLVHHGGAGPAMAAVAAGMPQLTLPVGMDQPTIGARVAAAGAGITVDYRDAGTGQILAAVRALLAEPAYREAAAGLRAENRRRAVPSAAVERLTALADT